MTTISFSKMKIFNSSNSNINNLYNKNSKYNIMYSISSTKTKTNQKQKNKKTKNTYMIICWMHSVTRSPFCLEIKCWHFLLKERFVWKFLKWLPERPSWLNSHPRQVLPEWRLTGEFRNSYANENDTITLFSIQMQISMP